MMTEQENEDELRRLGAAVDALYDTLRAACAGEFVGYDDIDFANLIANRLQMFGFTLASFDECVARRMTPGRIVGAAGAAKAAVTELTRRFDINQKEGR